MRAPGGSQGDLCNNHPAKSLSNSEIPFMVVCFIHVAALTDEIIEKMTSGGGVRHGWVKSAKYCRTIFQRPDNVLIHSFLCL